MTKSIKALAILGVVAGFGVASLPLSSYAEDPTNADNMTVKLSVSDFISLETKTADKTVNLGEVVNNGDIATGAGIINVKTNNTSGYEVKIAPAEGNTTDMVSGDNKIKAGTPTKNTSAWGYALTPEEGADVTTWSVLTSAGDTLTSTSAATDNDGDDISITFGASVDAQQPQGEYSTTLTFTASTKATPASN